MTVVGCPQKVVCSSLDDLNIIHRSLLTFSGILLERKTDKEKSHKRVWWSECPGSVPGINSGRPSRDTRDVWADLCGNSNSSGRMSTGQTGHMTGQMGHFHGTDGTHTRGCPAKILYAYWFFSFPREGGLVEGVQCWKNPNHYTSTLPFEKGCLDSGAVWTASRAV